MISRTKMSRQLQNCSGCHGLSNEALITLPECTSLTSVNFNACYDLTDECSHNIIKMYIIDFG